MTCAEFERTSALLDGELGPAQRAEAERHLADCPDCQAFAASAASFGDALRAPGVRAAAPPALRARVLARITTTAAAPPMLVPFRLRRMPGFVWGALGGAGVTSLAAALLLAVLAPPSSSGLESGLADAHSHALTHGDLVQVASSDHHKVKPWLARHAPLSPPVTDFAAQGFPLAGGARRPRARPGHGGGRLRPRRARDRPLRLARARAGPTRRRRAARLSRDLLDARRSGLRRRLRRPARRPAGISSTWSRRGGE